MTADNNQNASANDTMVEGHWTCGECGADITELPFEPDEDRLDQLRCRECHQKQRKARKNNTMHKGNWTCSQCGATITQLPFNPTRTDGLKCLDCYRKSQ